jgi:hypothetical protein
MARSRPPAGQLVRQRSVVALHVLEQQGGFGMAHHGIGCQVVKNPVTQVFGSRHGNVQQVVHGAGGMEGGEYGWQLGHPGRKAVNLFAVVGAKPDGDEGLDGPADGGQAQFRLKTLDDAAFGQCPGCLLYTF